MSPRKENPLDRFFRYVSKIDNGCWIWTGAVSGGRCVFWLNGKSIKAQEFILGERYSLGHKVHATCNNGLCVNPDHLVILEKMKPIIKKGDPLTLFMSHVKKIDGGCWEWTAAKSRGGYGIFRFKNKNVPAHRWLYEYINGEIPNGLECDHLCRNRLCVNPDHIEPVTKLENVRRGESGKWQRDKTHCPKGHIYDEENTLWYPHKHKNGVVYTTRVCKQCQIDTRAMPENRKRHKIYVKKWYENKNSASASASE